MAILRIGTRGSLLAKTQTQMVADALARANPGLQTELITITTSGDRHREGPLQNAGGKGLFVKELQQALMEKRIDLAVHSAKDLPVGQADGLKLVATPLRADPHDVWIGFNGMAIAELPHSAVVGTTSLRRAAQLRAKRPDLRIEPLRGNIDTRLDKVNRGVVAGTFLAKAGLDRTGLLPKTAVALPLDEFIPAVGQGTLALECRDDDRTTQLAAEAIHDGHTGAALEFERKVVESLAGDCLAPIGVLARPRHLDHPGSKGWIFRALIALPDGSEMARAAIMGEEALPDAASLKLLLETLQRRGAAEIMDKLRLLR
jgi:hydroxymethylbilane synthase